MGREEHCKQIALACVGSACSVSATPGLPRSQHVWFPSLHCSGSRLLCQELSEAGPGLCALPRSKLLKFRFSGTPQRRRLGWAYVLCPSQVQAAQGTSAWQAQLPLAGDCILAPPLSQPLGFLGVQPVHLLRCAVCLFWGADLWL